MLLKAAEDYNIDLGSSWMIGDRERDVEAGKNARCGTIYLCNNPESSDADYTASFLREAIHHLLNSCEEDSMKKSDLFWQSYLNLEKSFLELANYIFYHGYSNYH